MTGKPRNPAYPEHLTTLGDHIRKRTLDLGLLQNDVAVIVNATTLGERIKQYRIQKGLSQRKLAMQLGIDTGTLTRWERGEGALRGKCKERVDSFLKILAG